MEFGTLRPEPGALPYPERTCIPQSLLALLGSSNVDEQDMDTILDQAGGFPNEDWGRAEQVLSTSAFQDWFVDRGSRRLLVHGDYDVNDYPEISPLSKLCTAIVQKVRTRPNLVGLVFFCGRHLDQRHNENIGASGLVRSFIAQLLRQCPSTCWGYTLDPDISLTEVENGDLEHLTKLFTTLILHSPRTTFMVVIDGVLAYEQEEYCEGLYKVVDMLCKLAEDEVLSYYVPIKILLTSPTETSDGELRERFQRHHAILSMTAMPNAG
ncbi:hypothetical protein F4821DRAFT_78965 [Hypoxylon rubiginosum]|uniref:Uncharacterized protein n=1 Tax=Hypoxylon rubiginosum TaxID=110542 RepID=A0ACC0DL38_9PEZI|nr:hypothetical protein F4821DRAFT_78965 [Hypoxylon rubiginosum]